MAVVSLAVRSDGDDAARADDARRPEGEAAPREPPRRREGRPRRRQQARGRRRPRPLAPRRPRPRRRRGRRRVSPARTSTRRSAGSTRAAQEMPVRVSGKPKEVAGFRSMVVATPRRRPGHPRRDRRRAGHGRGAAEARPRQRRPGGRHRRLQAEQGEHGRRRRGGDEGDREAPRRAPAVRRDPGRAGRLGHDQGVGPRRDEHADHRRLPDRPHRLPLPQLLAVDRHHGAHAPDLGHLLVHRHVLPRDDAERHDAHGALARDRAPHRRRDRRPGEHREAPRARAGPHDRGAGRDRRDRPRGPRDDALHRRRLRPGRLHEGDHGALLLPVRDHGRLRGPRLPLRLLHARPDALLPLGRPRRRADREAPRRGARPRPLQRLVRPDGGPLQGARRLGPRPPEDGPGLRRPSRSWRDSSSSGRSRPSSWASTTRPSSRSSSRRPPTPPSRRPAGGWRPSSPS